jgi:hypothetical protein
MEVGCFADVCKGPGADALSFQERFEEDKHLFLRPIAEIARIDFMHPAGR